MNDDVEVFVCEPDAALSRREAERDGVRRLLSNAFRGETVPRMSHHPSGAPFLEGCDVSVSVSHCAGCVALAVDRKGRRVGIDAESCDRSLQLRRVAHKFLSPSQAVVWGDVDTSLVRAWTIKEALYKAIGVAGLPLVDIPLPAAGADMITEHGVTVDFRGNCYLLRAVRHQGFYGCVTLAVEIFEGEKSGYEKKS